MDRPATMSASPCGAAGALTPTEDTSLVEIPIDDTADAAVTAEALAAENRPVEARAAGTAAAQTPPGETRADEVPTGLTRAAGSEEAHGAGHLVFELPRVPALLLHALPRFVEGCVAPVVVFYTALTWFGYDNHGAWVSEWAKQNHGQAAKSAKTNAAKGLSKKP